MKIKNPNRLVIQKKSRDWNTHGWHGVSCAASIETASLKLTPSLFSTHRQPTPHPLQRPLLRVTSRTHRLLERDEKEKPNAVVTTVRGPC